MNSNGTRIAAVLITLAAVVVLFFVFKGGDDNGDSTTTTAETAATTAESAAATAKKKAKKDTAPSVPVIDVVGGQPKGGVAELAFDKGDEIRFEVKSDAADEIHVHGYDIEEEVPAGGKAKFDFPAELEGVFEVELHGSEAQIAELTVNP